MKPMYFYAAVIATGILTGACTGRNEPQKSFLLRDNWAIQSSKDTGGDGKIISTTAYQPEKW